MRNYVLLGMVAVMLLTSGCNASRAASPPPAPPPPEVQVIQVQPQDVPIHGEWVGTLDGLVNADIKAQVSGYIVRQDYHEGDRVRLGQLLFELDPRPFEATLSQVTAQIASVQGQVAQASSQEAQARAGLMQAESQRLQAEANLASARSQLKQAEAALDEARANQVKTQLEADRDSKLLAADAMSRRDFDNAVQTNTAAQAAVAGARARVMTAQDAIRAAAAQLATARAAVMGAAAQIATAHAAVVAAQAQVAAAQAQAEAARLNLGFTRIAAPIDGVAGLSRAQVGDLVGPTTEVLTTVSTVDPIKAFFTVPEQELHTVDWKTRRYELVNADGTVYPAAGRFFAQDRNVASATGAVRMACVFPNPQGTLKPGQYARVRTVRVLQHNVIMVPQRAVTELQDRNQVAVVGPDNKIDIRNVQLGERIETRWIVESGLHAGDRVVIEGSLKIRPGQVVAPVEK